MMKALGAVLKQSHGEKDDIGMIAAGRRVRARSYKDIENLYPIRRRTRSLIRDGAIYVASISSKIDRTKEWVRFPCYHHVFDDERRGFERHLKFMRDYGEFISMDDAVDVLEKRRNIGGRYFCVTLDDGFKNCVENALPIMIENTCKAAFFITTDYVGRDVDEDWDIISRFFSISADAYPIPVEFLNWNDCKMLTDAGMTVGSHASSHIPLSALTNDEAWSEMADSKKVIEEKLGIVCHHFSSPMGVPGRDFNCKCHPAMAKKMGYRSFFTAQRGANTRGADPYAIRRDHMIAKWDICQLRFFFAR